MNMNQTGVDGQIAKVLPRRAKRRALMVGSVLDATGIATAYALQLSGGHGSPSVVAQLAASSAPGPVGADQAAAAYVDAHYPGTGATQVIQTEPTTAPATTLPSTTTSPTATPAVQNPPAPPAPPAPPGSQPVQAAKPTETVEAVGTAGPHTASTGSQGHTAANSKDRPDPAHSGSRSGSSRNDG